MLAMHQLHYSEAVKQTPTGITEIILPTIADPHGGDLVLPMIAHLSQSTENRWFTWIGPEPLSREKARRYQLKEGTLRFIHAPNDRETLWMFWEALSNGNSATVVAMLDFIDERNRRLLESASKQGGSLGIILRRRKF